MGRCVISYQPTIFHLICYSPASDQRVRPRHGCQASQTTRGPPSCRRAARQASSWRTRCSMRMWPRRTWGSGRTTRGAGSESANARMVSSTKENGSTTGLTLFSLACTFFYHCLFRKYGYGVTTFKDGSREEGKYKNNILITSNKKKHLFLIRSAKFRERIDSAVNAAQRASKIALQKADIAISRWGWSADCQRTLSAAKPSNFTWFSRLNMCNIWQ